MEHADDAMSERATRGIEALGELWERHHRELLGFVRARTHDPQNAEDVLQEAYLLTHAHWAECEGETSEVGFLRKWCTIALWRFYRREKRALLPLTVETIRRLQDAGQIPADDRPGLAELPEKGRGPEDCVLGQEREQLYLHAVFHHGGYPHQVICFGFSKLLGDWKPQRIVEQLSSQLLRRLASNLEKEYRDFSVLPRRAVHSHFEHLHGRLRGLLAELINERDSATRTQLARLLGKRAGETALEHYYGTRPIANVTDWSFKVTRRVKEHLVMNHAEELLS